MRARAARNALFNLQLLLRRFHTYLAWWGESRCTSCPCCRTVAQRLVTISYLIAFYVCPGTLLAQHLGQRSEMRRTSRHAKLSCPEILAGPGKEPGRECPMLCLAGTRHYRPGACSPACSFRSPLARSLVRSFAWLAGRRWRRPVKFYTTPGPNHPIAASILTALYCTVLGSHLHGLSARCCKWWWKPKKFTVNCNCGLDNLTVDIPQLTSHPINIYTCLCLH